LAIWRSRSLFWRFGDHGHFFSGDHFLVDGDHRDPKKLKKIAHAAIHESLSLTCRTDVTARNSTPQVDASSS
jgi:hypothetical protein